MISIIKGILAYRRERAAVIAKLERDLASSRETLEILQAEEQAARFTGEKVNSISSGIRQEMHKQDAIHKTLTATKRTPKWLL